MKSKSNPGSFSLITLGDRQFIYDGPNTNYDLKDEEVIDCLWDYIDDEFSNRTHCPYCSERLQQQNLSINNDLKFTDYIIWVCCTCAYWQFYYYSEFVGRDFLTDATTAAASKIREFNTLMPDGVDNEIAQQLRRNQNGWLNISPKRLEQLVASIIKCNYKDCEVIHTGQSHDGGKDVLFIDTNENSWLVQVKRRSSRNASEGVQTLRNLLGTMILHKSRYGIFVSTADHFTTAAYRAQEKAKQLGVRVELLDRGILNRIIGGLLPKRPWMDALKYINDEELISLCWEKVPDLKDEECKLDLQI